MEGGAVNRPRRQSAFAKAAPIRHAKMRDGMKALKVARVAGVKFSIRSAAKLVNVPFSTFRDYHENCIQDKPREPPKVFGRRGQKAQLIEPYFSNVGRVTMMAVAFSDGTLGKPLFVFGGSKLRYRTFLSGEGQRTESILDSLPPGAVATTRDGAPGVDSAIFLRYMQSFVHDVRERTSNGRKVLLLYDAYRPHMSIHVLELLCANNIIAFALPAHTSGTTQPLDVSCFSPWKKKARSYIRAMPTNALVTFDEFDMCRILSRAYCHSFTPANVQAGFRKAGVCPLDANKLIGMPRVRSAADLSTVVDSKAMFAILEERRVAVATAVGIQPQVAAHGFIDTSHGVNLTAPEAMDIVRKKEEHRHMKKIAEKQKQLKAEEERYGKRRHREHIEMFALRTRARRWGMPLVAPRSLRHRRMIAARKAARKRNAHAGPALMPLPFTCSLLLHAIVRKCAQISHWRAGKIDG